VGLRAYLMVDITDDLDQRQFVKALRELEDTQGVDFVDPVFGVCDMVVMVEAPVSIEALVDKIRTKPWIKNLEVLRIVSIFQRHHASKKKLLKALNHSGFKNSE